MDFPRHLPLEKVMKRRPIDIVSLDALRVFECAARLMSFSAAAQELSVTQAAVSRRIKQLEHVLGFDLFHRNGRQLSLTIKGQRLFLRTQASLEFLGVELDDLTAQKATSTVLVAASAAVSHLWLSSRLRRFNDRYPEISVRLIVSDNLSELAQADSQLALIHSRGMHPNWALTHLFSEQLVPVAAPAYLKTIGYGRDPLDLQPKDLGELALYDYHRAGVQTLTLGDWFEEKAPGVPRSAPRVVFPTYMMAVEAALRGEGIVLGSRALIKPYLESRELVELTRDVMKTGFGYYLGVPRRTSVSEAEETLANFLLSERLI